MIKISNEINDSKLGSEQVVKICRGVDVIWEKLAGETISWTTDRKIPHDAKYLTIPKEYRETIRDKEIISIHLKGVGTINNGITNRGYGISFSKSFKELIGATDDIPAGIEIIVTYK